MNLKSNNIAVFMGGLQFDAQRKLAEGIWKAAKEQGDNIFLFAADVSSGEQFNVGEFTIFDLPDIEKFDGIIFYSETIYDDFVRDKLISKIRDKKVPCVSINYDYPDMVNISDDNWNVMQDIVDGLVERHHVKKVNYIGGPEFSNDDIIRLTSVKERLAKYGITLNNERIFHGDYQALSGRRAIKFFQEHDLLDVDAFICSNDQMAMGAYYALKELGINVPEDVLLTGFDNIFIARAMTPRITTVNREERKLGRLAYEALTRVIDGNSEKQDLMLPCKVVWCESTGDVTEQKTDQILALNHFTRMKLRTSRYAFMVSDTAAVLSAVNNYTEFDNQLKKYIPDLEADQLYICLNEENQGDYTGFSDVLDVEIAYKNGEFFKHNQVRRGDILPGGLKNSGSGNFYVISPIHYLENCYGYSVICNSVLPMENDYYHMFIMNMGNGIQSIKEYNKMQDMIKMLDERWIYDALTQVYNRGGFFKYAEEYIQITKTVRQKLFFLFLDLDHLKLINDELGHDYGDKAICAIATILKETKKPDELLMRYGGDEFVILGRAYTEKDAKEYLAKIQAAMDAYNEVNKMPIPLEASMGYYIVDSNMEQPIATLIELADQEMYKMKKQHREEKSDK